MRRQGAVLLALVLGSPELAAADGCTRGCQSALRRCRDDAVDLTRPSRSARVDGDPTARRADARALRAELHARCARLAASCRGCCATAGRRCGGATIEVDDPEARGSPGDGRLSLVEAIDLAASRLDPSALDARERRHVHGVAGAGRADRIRFVRRLVVAIRRIDSPVVSILPSLDAGDAILGADTRLDGSAMGGVPQAGPGSTVIATDTGVTRGSFASLLTIAGSDVLVTGLHLDRVAAAGIAIAGAPGAGASGIFVLANRFTGLGRQAGLPGIALAAGGNAARLADVWVAGNRLLGVHVPVSVVGGAANAVDEAARGNVVEHVRILDNTAEQGTGGVFICAGAATFGGVVEDNLVTDVAVARNRIVENLDVGLGVSSSCLLAGGVGNRNQSAGIRFTANQLFTPPTFGRTNSAVFVSGAQLSLGGGGSSGGDRVTDVTVEDTHADGVSGAAVVVAGYLERCGGGCTVHDGIVERVTFRRNRWRNLDTGIVLLGSGAVEAAGTVERNALRAVTLDGENVAARLTALSIEGGLAGSIDLCSGVFAGCVEFPGYRQPAVIRQSEIADVAIVGSTLKAPDAVTIAGGLSDVTTDTVTGTAIRRLSLRRSMIDAERTSVLLAGGIVVTGGSITGCGVDAAELEELTTPAGGRAAVLQVADVGVGAPPGSASGNFLTGVVVD